MRTATAKRESRIRPVSIDSLQVPRAGKAQREFSQAWADAIAADFDMGKLGYPVVNRVGDINWVIDGQHRLAAFRKQPRVTRGTTLECEVYEGLDDQGMADLFLGRNRSRVVNAFERFSVAVTAGHPKENAIVDVVNAAKLELKADHRKGCIFAVAALKRVFAREGPAVLRRVLETLRDAYDSVPGAFGRPMVEGLGLVVGVYGPRIHNESLIAALGKDRHGVNGVLRRAEEYRERVGRPQPQCVAAAIVDVYNEGRRGAARIPRWWKV